ncbi:MAG: DUF2145 domain-containing protein [Paraglaciecola sp.]|nr:DUF2145 domain-containing protein [Paraglaciecola sp.]
MRSIYVVVFCTMVLTGQVLAADKGSGNGCDKIIFGPQGYIKALQMSSKLSDYLEKKHLSDGTSVVLLGRAGSNSPSTRFTSKVSQYWSYTHAGLAYREHPFGQWTVVHLLNDCGQKSSIYQESLSKFFLDDPYEYKVVVAIPDPALQAGLHDLIVNKNLATALFNNSTYSSVSNPFNTQRQNSNEYILDTLTAAMAHMAGNRTVFTREQAKDYLHSSGLVKKVSPERVKVKGIESLGLALGFGPENATLDDHPRSERRDGAVSMVSVGTLITFLQDTAHLLSTTELALQDRSKASDTTYQQ